MERDFGGQSRMKESGAWGVATATSTPRAANPSPKFGFWPVLLTLLTPFSWIGRLLLTLLRWLVGLQVGFFVFGVGLGLPIAFFLLPVLPEVIHNYEPPIFGGWYGVWGLVFSSSLVAFWAYQKGFAGFSALLFYAMACSVVIVSAYGDGKGWGPYFIGLMLVWPPLLLLDALIPRPGREDKDDRGHLVTPSPVAVRAGVLWHALVGAAVTVTAALVLVSVFPKRYPTLESVVFRVVSPLAADAYSMALMRRLPPEWQLPFVKAMRNDRAALEELRPLVNEYGDFYAARMEAIVRIHRILQGTPRRLRVRELQNLAGQGDCTAELLLMTIWWEMRPRPFDQPEVKHCPGDERAQFELQRSVKAEFEQVQNRYRIDF